MCRHAETKQEGARTELGLLLEAAFKGKRALLVADIVLELLHELGELAAK